MLNFLNINKRKFTEPEPEIRAEDSSTDVQEEDVRDGETDSPPTSKRARTEGTEGDTSEIALGQILEDRFDGNASLMCRALVHLLKGNGEQYGVPRDATGIDLKTGAGNDHDADAPWIKESEPDGGTIVIDDSVEKKARTTELFVRWLSAVEVSGSIARVGTRTVTTIPIDDLDHELPSNADELKSDIVECYSASKDHVRCGLLYGIRCGRGLEELKKQVKRGGWKKVVEEEVGMSMGHCAFLRRLASAVGTYPRIARLQTSLFQMRSKLSPLTKHLNSLPLIDMDQWKA